MKSPFILSAILLLHLHDVTPLLGITFDSEKVLFANPLPSPQQVCSADLDGDGDTDVIAIGYTNEVGALVWFENLDALGTMSGPQLVVADADLRYVAPLDVDDDGDIDLLAAPQGIGSLRWYENTDALGTFARTHEIPDSRVRYTTTLDSADLDGDGDLDPYWTLGAGRAVEWLPNLGGGLFGPIQSIDADARGIGGADHADVDHDGDLDLVVAFESTEMIGLYRNDGTGHFSPRESIITGRRFTGCWLGDISGNGRTDVVTLGGSEVLLFEQDAWGIWGSPTLLFQSESYSGSLSLADADADGDLDIGIQMSPMHLLLRNDGQGHFTSESLTDMQFIGRDIALAQMDDDTELEVLAAIYPGTLGVFDKGQFHSWSDALDTINALEAADLDGDGDIDLASIALFSNHVAWHEQLNDGSFETHIVSSSHPFPTRLLLADVTGDHQTDIVVGTETEIIVFPGMEDRFGSAMVWAADLALPTSMTVGDMDHDDAPDLLVSTGGGSKIWWLRQGMEKQCLYQHHESLNSLAVGDLDQDGWEDLLVATGADQQILWLRNEKGSGRFAEPATLARSLQSSPSLDAVDLDGDGDLDVLAMSLSIRNEGVYWLENEDGQGTFSGPHTITTSVSRLLNADAKDLDADGDLDIVSISRDRRVAWYENVGSGTFGPQQRLSTSGYTPSQLCVTDVDADSIPDILTVSDGDTIHWHGSATTPTDSSGSVQILTIARDFLIYERPIGVPTRIEQSQDLEDWNRMARRETLESSQAGRERVRAKLSRLGRGRRFYRVAW